MNTPTSTRLPTRPSEEGYILVMVVFMVALLVIAMSLAGPVIRKEIQRDREIETMHRGKQYVRGVRMYYKKFGAYPPTVDALINTNQIRFLRRKYIDPTTGKDEWKIIHVGQNKTQTLGFFGQPIGGSTIAGIGPGAGGPNPSGGMFNSPPGTGGSGSTFGSTNFGTTSSTPIGTTGSPSDGSSGTGAAGTTSTDPNAPGGTTPSGTASSTGSGLTGQTFGGGGIIGVSPNSPKQSILAYKKKNHYNEWEFFYDPIAEQMLMQGGAIGQPAGTPTQVGAPGVTAPGVSGPGIGGGSATDPTNPTITTPTPAPAPQQ